MTNRYATGFLAAGFLALGTALAADAAKPAAEIPPGYVLTGESARCLSTSRIDSMRILNARQILVKMSNGEAYLQQPRSCSRLRTYYALSYETFGGQICNSTTVTLLDSGSGLNFAGVCFFDEFQKLEKQSAAAE